MSELKKEIRMMEFRAVENEENKMVLEGYAVVFNQETQIGDDTFGFREVIDPTAFDNCNMKDVPLKYNHENNVPILARTRNGSLRLEVDDKGLKITATLLDTSDGRDMYARVKAGLLDKMSFAFTASGTEWEDLQGALPLRRVTAINRLYDVSIVDMPAYDGTSIGARRKDYGYKEHCSEEINTIMEKYTTLK
jgi:uncharacterized protein